MFPSGDRFNNIRRNGERDEATVVRGVLDLFARLYTDYVTCLRDFHSQYDELIRNGNPIPADVHERQLRSFKGHPETIQLACDDNELTIFIGFKDSIEQLWDSPCYGHQQGWTTIAFDKAITLNQDPAFF
uniref:Nudc_N domain-containing protein n=1 Tax=Angiostrongylus cantonensis TaxID=6313 RepID=A0A0K0DQS6_ANGCA